MITVEAQEVKGIVSTAGEYQVVGEGGAAIQMLLDEIKGGRHLSVACRTRNETTSGGVSARSKFLDGLIAAARAADVVVLDHNADEMTAPYIYILSQNFVAIASGMNEFAICKERFDRALQADRRGDWNVSPWGDFSRAGANLFSEGVRSLNRPVLAVARIRIDLRDDGQAEPNYSYGTEVPIFSRAMTIAFTISEKRGDWRDIATILDYFVDETEERISLFKGKRRVSS